MDHTTELWIDALDFQEKGGWKEDTQYVHLMGSGYLIAADEPGVPVEDAVVRVTIPEDGKYRAWVRDRNWLRRHSPGTFNLVVNGENNGRILGAMPSDSWLWEIAGDFDLRKGECSIALHDLTGYFGRCAAILLTTDRDYVPPREVERFHRERARIKGLNTGITFGGDYDVFVVGGGPAGFPAAVASAREGARTLLIQDRQMLGGNGSSEVGVPFEGASSRYFYSRESGIAEELHRLRDRNPSFVGDWTGAMEEIAAAEQNLTVICDMHVIDVEKSGETAVTGVKALNIRTLERSRYTGRIFIDCTGDAWLGYYAGAKYRCGREAKYEHGESIAPEIADTITMSGCIKSGNRTEFFDTGKPVEYHAPDWVPRLPESELEFGRVIKGIRMHWWLEIPGDYDDMWDGEESRDALLLVILGFYDHMKNAWDKRDTAANYTLHLASVINGRRESRRLIGDYVLTQDDCTSGRDFDDAIAYSGWALDVHHPKGIYSGSEGPLYCATGVNRPKVPYRCTYSKNIDNLFFCGRNVSATHIALGTLRVQKTIMIVSQAVGTAAAMCIRLNESPRGIYLRHMRELQQLLIKNDLYIPGVKNEDPDDPCLTASVTASSVSKVETMKTRQGSEGELWPLDVPRCAMLGVDNKKGDLQQLCVKLHSAHPEPFPVRLYACTLGDDVDTTAEPGETFSSVTRVPPGESWVAFPIHIPIAPDENAARCYIRLWIEPTEGISWRSMKNLSFYHSTGIFRDGKWQMTVSTGLCAAPKEPKKIPADCSPMNVINGISRIVDAEHYEWVSDPARPMPQWIELCFQKSARISTVSVVFDTDLSDPSTAKEIKIPEVPVCVKDYNVELLIDGTWRRIAEVKDNFMRRRLHSFAPVTTDGIRVTVLSTCGDPSARIMEIRAWL